VSPIGVVVGASDPVHLWWIRLDGRCGDVDRQCAALAVDERARARLLRRETDHARYVASHTFLRNVLARYLPLAPRAIEFRRNSHGKPEVVSAQGTRWQFNFADGGDLALCAVATRSVGVDVEQVRSVSELDAIAAEILDADNRDRLARLGGHDRLAAFFAGWTLQEAYLKAKGVGLSAGLRPLSVDLSPRSRGRWQVVDGPLPDDRWSLLWCEPAEGYRAAVALQGDGSPIVSQWFSDFAEPI
jgi:4'-phosphopantetheinyl transferase